MSTGEPIVLDHGTGFIRAGAANPDNDPGVVMPTAMCPIEDAPQQPGTAGKPTNGNSLPNHGAFEIEWAAANIGKVMRPISRGLIKDWDLMEDMWRYILYSLCGWELGNEGQVLIAEPLRTPKWSRERIAQVMFETFNTSGLFVVESAVLSLYAFGRVSGCAVDIGHGKIDIAPVWEGAVQHAAVRQIDLAGQDLTALTRSLLASSASLPDSFDDVAADALKERHAIVAEDQAAYQKALASNEKVHYTLPDGQVIEVGGGEAYKVGEALFRPQELLDSEEDGLPEQVFNCISHSIPTESHRQLLENIVLCGGTSTMKGLEARFLRDITQLAPPSIRPAIVKPPDYMPDNTLRNAAWMGGAILSKVVFPQNQHVTKAEYDESGPYIIHKKCYTG